MCVQMFVNVLHVCQTHNFPPHNFPPELSKSWKYNCDITLPVTHYTLEHVLQTDYNFFLIFPCIVKKKLNE